jgi:hypothetical protein
VERRAHLAALGPAVPPAVVRAVHPVIGPPTTALTS